MIIITLTLLIFNIPFLQRPVAAFIIKRALASENITCKLESSHFTLNKLKATGVELNFYNEIVKIPNFEAEISWQKLLQKKAAYYHAIIPEIIFGDNFLKLKADLSGRVNIFSHSFLTSGSIEVYSGSWLEHNKLSYLKLFTNLKFNNGKTFINNFDLNISDQGNISFSGIVGYRNYPYQLTELELAGNIKTLPLSLYQVIAPIGHPVRSFFDEYIIAGEINSGNWQIKLPDEFFKNLYCDKTKIGFKKCQDPKFSQEYINANLTVKDFSYKYNPNLPAIEKLNTNITLQGSKLLINLISADVGGTLIKNGLVDLDWLEPNIVVNAKAEAAGEVTSLLKFISSETIAKMKASNIDLSSLKGKAFTKVNLSIPLAENIPNKYDITTNVPHLTGKLFGEKAYLQKMHLRGSFDGDKVELIGDGNINNFKSNVKVVVNISDEPPIQHHIKAKIWLAGGNGNDGKDHVIITHGKVPLDIEYTGKRETSTFKASADLTKLGFNVNSISLTKPLGRQAKLAIDGEVTEGKKQALNIKLTGEDNLNILGSINIEDQISKLKLSEVRYSNNNFQAEVTFAPKKLKAKITGGLLDLSKSDFASIFKKDENQKIEAIKLAFHLDEVRLKNNTKLRQVLFALDCDHGHCQRAEFNSFINSEIFRATMSNSQDYDIWEVETSDAGALFNGVGLTDKIKNGRFRLFFKIPTDSLSPNRTIEGNFRLVNFLTKKNKFLARIVSFISVPGLLSSLTTSNIPFDLVKGDFALKEGVILLPEIEADGSYFSFNIRGTIDTNTKKADLKGRVIPSLYGLNKLVGSFPLIGALFGKGRGILFAPVYIKENY